jgi:hypothetical protein
MSFRRKYAEDWVDKDGNINPFQPPTERLEPEAEVTIDPRRYDAWKAGLQLKGLRPATDDDYAKLKAKGKANRAAVAEAEAAEVAFAKDLTELIKAHGKE